VKALQIGKNFRPQRTKGLISIFPWGNFVFALPFMNLLKEGDKK